VAERAQVTSELSRDLNLFHITMMGLGMMIGAGVFIGIGNVMYKAGPGGLLLTFALNGLIAIFTAMSYAELSSAVPRAGGAYNFARIGFGRGTSFLAGWMEWFASSVAGSLYAVVFATYTLEFFVQLGYLDVSVSAWGIKAVAFLIACFFIYINYRGTSETGKIGAFFTLGQMILIGLVGVVGICYAFIEPERLRNFQPFIHPDGWLTILVTMGFTSVAFEGFEVIAQAGDETIDPKRNIPKAMLYSVCVVTVTYIAVAFASVVAVHAGDPALNGLAPWEWVASFGDTGFGQAVAKLMPTRFLGYVLVTMAVIFASTSALNATIFSATRASYALGRDRMLPGSFSWISQRRRTPWVALVFTGVIVIAVAVFLPTRDVGSSASIMFLLLFFLVNLCVIKIRRDMGDELSYGFLIPLFPLFPILAIICQAVLAVFLHEMSWVAWVVAPVWIGLGFVIYLLYSRTRAVTTEHEIHVLEEEHAPERTGYQILVSVANPVNALGLVRNTYRLAQAHDAHIDLLHMVPVPSQVPLSDAKDYMFEGKEAIVEAMLYLAPLFPLSTHLRYCRNLARGIISTVREKKTDMLIMGWHGRPGAHSFAIGSTVDPVIERAPCHVVIFKDCGSGRFKRVLVPIAGGPNGVLALEVASILTDKDVGEIVAFTVTSGRKRFDLEQFVDRQKHRLRIPRGRVRFKEVLSKNVVEAILSEAENYDLIVLGATAEPIVSRVAHLPLPETFARRCNKPLVMVRAAAGLRSWIRRWI
jgi:APA family basic amino acid/polyamine antiporter